MKKLVSLLSMLAIVLIAGVAFAQDEEAKATDYYFEDEDGPVFYITFPETWTAEWSEGEALTALQGLSKDESVLISVMIAHGAKDFAAAGEAIDKILDGLVTDFNFSEPKEGTLNGMKVMATNSKAKLVDGGDEVEVGLIFFTPKENEFYILYTLGSAEAEKQHAEEITAIINSLRTKE